MGLNSYVTPVIQHPEMPFLAAGAVAIVGGVIESHGWPANGAKALVGTSALVIVASATADSRITPLVHAIGLLLLLASVMATVNAVNRAHTKADPKTKTAKEHK